MLANSAASSHGETAHVPDPGELADSQERAMLRRLSAYGQASSLRRIYDGLTKLGYRSTVPSIRVPGKQPEPYLSWFDPARGGPTVIRFNAVKLWFIMNADLPALADLPRGRTETGGDRHNVNFPVRDEHVEAILEGARRLKQ
jgi:hypothetical protein